MKIVDFLATDGIGLNGILYNENTNTKDVILSVHGMSSNCFKKRESIIANEANRANIDYFCFNNRGSELVKYIRKNIDGKKEKILAGTSYEDVLEGYEDIVGAILKLKEMDYTNIYLQGHSLGCTKIVYTYNELKDAEDDLIDTIKGVILLSLVNIPQVLKIYLRDNYNSYLKLAEEKESQGKLYDLMPKEAFIHPISVKSFLRYTRDNNEIKIDNYSKVNNIKDPIFMRWGTQNEMIVEKPDELVVKVSNIIENNNKDIDYIEGADHGYHGKEELIAKQIVKFIEKQRRNNGTKFKAK